MIYLASPYSDPEPKVEIERFRETCRVLAGLFMEKRHVFSPVVHCHPVAIRHGLPGDFNFWQEFNRDMIRRCDRFDVLMLNGWRESVGIEGETSFARSIDKPVRCLSPATGILYVDAPDAAG